MNGALVPSHPPVWTTESRSASRIRAGTRDGVQIGDGVGEVCATLCGTCARRARARESRARARVRAGGGVRASEDSGDRPGEYIVRANGSIDHLSLAMYRNS